MKELLLKLVEGLEKEAVVAGLTLTEAVDNHSIVSVLVEKVKGITMAFNKEVEALEERRRLAEQGHRTAVSETATELKKLSDEKESHDAIIIQKQSHISDLNAKETRAENNVRALLAEQAGIEESLTGLRVQENQLKRTIDALITREAALKASIASKTEEEAALVEDISKKTAEKSKLSYEVTTLEDRKKQG